MPAVTRSISSQLTSSGGAGVADVDQIAFSYKVENGYTVMDLTVKDKLNAIQQQVDGIQTVSEQQILSISLSASQASQSETSAANSASQALDSASQALNSATSAASDKADALRAKEYVEGYADKIDNISETMLDLSTSFDVDARIQIMTEDAYNALLLKDGNTMYFLYDEATVYNSEPSLNDNP